MRLKSYIFLPLCCAGIALLTACGPGNEKKDVLPIEKMADVLYDYQLAQTLSESIADSLPKAPIEYRLSVFYKYGISAREFDHSLAYYSRHAEEMKKVYARIDAKYDQSGRNGTAGAGGGAQSSDSLQLWQTPQAVLTAQVAPQVTFRVKPQQKVPVHSTLSLLFSADWLYGQGLKQAASVIRVRYANDSTETFANGVYSYQRDQELRLSLGSKSAVREVEIKFMQNVGWQSTPQILTLSDLRLVAVRPTSTTP